MQEIPEEPSKGYRPELARPTMSAEAHGLTSETWFDVQRDAAIALWDVRTAWDFVQWGTGATGLLGLPARWISTRLLREVHELATFVVRFTAIGAPTPPDEESGFPGRLDAIGELTGVDALGLLRERATSLHEAMRGPLVNVGEVERAAAELAWITREFARCALYRIDHQPPPADLGRTVYADALGHIERAAAAGMNLGDPSAARLLDVVAAVCADLNGSRLPLQGIVLPTAAYSGKGKHERSIQALAEEVQREVFPAMASHRHQEGPAGGALLRVALVMGLGSAEVDDEALPFYDALRRCYRLAGDDPRVWELDDEPAFARQLVLRALDALGFDTKEMLAAEGQRAKRGGRADEFRKLDEAGRAQRVRRLLKSHQGGALAVSRYLGVPVGEVRAVMPTNDVRKVRPKRG